MKNKQEKIIIEKHIYHTDSMIGLSTLKETIKEEKGETNVKI